MIKKLFSWKKSAQRSVGLDIGSRYLKIVEIEKKGNTFEVTGIAMKDVKNSQNITEDIKKICGEAGISGKDVNLSLAGANVVARYLSLPKMTKEELKKSIEFELEDHIPFKPSDTYSDYQILEDEPDTQNKSRIFLVACKKDFLEAKTELVQKAGLKPKIVTMDALALKNTLYLNYPEDEKNNIGILNIGDKTSNLIIARRRVPHFIRDTNFGGEILTNLLQTKLGLSREKAESLKNNLANATPEAMQIIKTTLTSLLNEIFISIDFFEDLTEQKIDKLYITGGSSQLYSLKEFLKGYLYFDIPVLDPFKNFTFSSKLPREDILKLSPYFTVAIGLALDTWQ